MQNDNCIRLKAQLLEIKEYMNYIPLNPMQEGLNTYEIQEIQSK